MDFIQELIKEKKSLEKRIEVINAALEAYVGNDNEPVKQKVNDPIMSKFPVNGTYLEQLIYVIKSHKRFIHASEITDIIAPYYIDKDKAWLKRRVSAVLSTAKSKGEIPNLINFNYSNSKRDTVWGSKDWLDGNGNILTEFKFIPKAEEEKEKEIL